MIGNTKESSHVFSLVVDLMANDILPSLKYTERIVLRDCTSAQWKYIAQALASLKRLTALTIERCDVDDGFWQALIKSKSLLRLIRCSSISASIGDISSLASLEELKIDHMQKLTESDYRRIFRGLKNLKELEIMPLDVKQINLYCLGLTEPMFKLVAKNLPKLINLNIGDNPIGGSISDIIVAGFPLLTELHIDCVILGQQQLLTICRNLDLITLSIGENKCGDGSASIVARHLPRLQVLWAYIDYLGSEAISLLSCNLTKLGTIKCFQNSEMGQGCSIIGKLPELCDLDISSTGLKNWTAVVLASQLRKLSYFSVSGCNIQEQSLELIRRRLRKGAELIG